MCRHALAGPVGFREPNTSPPLLTAKQNRREAHEIPVSRAPRRSAFFPSLIRCHDPAPPAGFALVNTPRAPSTAAQNPADGHDSETKARDATCAGVHLEAGPTGFEVLTTSPLEVLATHSRFDGQSSCSTDCPLKGVPASRHEPVALSGAVDANTKPLLSTATHSCSDGQDTRLRVPFGASAWGSWSITVGDPQLNASAAEALPNKPATAALSSQEAPRNLIKPSF
jgi:hypothetical protein